MIHMGTTWIPIYTDIHPKCDSQLVQLDAVRCRLRRWRKSMALGCPRRRSAEMDTSARFGLTWYGLIVCFFLPKEEYQYQKSEPSYGKTQTMKCSSGRELILTKDWRQQHSIMLPWCSMCPYDFLQSKRQVKLSPTRKSVEQRQIDVNPVLKLTAAIEGFPFWIGLLWIAGVLHRMDWINPLSNVRSMSPGYIPPWMLLLRPKGGRLPTAQIWSETCTLLDLCWKEWLV